MHSSATIISLQQAQPALPAQQSVPLALGTADTEGTQVAVKEGAAAASFSPTPRSDQIRMTVSLAPLETTALRVAAPQDVFAPVEKQLSAAIGSIPKTAGEPVPASPQPQLASLADRAPRSDGRVAATLAAEPKQAGRDAQPPAAISSERTQPVALGTADTEGTQVAVKEGAAAASFSPTPRSDQIRMTVSLAPLETTALRVAAPQDVFAPVEKQLSAAIGSIPKTAGEPVPASPQPQLASLADRAPRSDGRVAATLAAEPKQAGRDAQPPAAISSERTQPVRSSSLEKDASSGDRSGRAFGPESATGAARTLASPESAKPFAMPAFAPLEAAAANRGDGLRVAAATTASAMSSVEGIERLVERLSVAREFDTKSASIAVTHREFGALTVTFDYARNGLDVEIAAKDNDMQRALALAVAADRPTGRAGEPPQQSLPQTSQTNFAASERGAGTAGQGANSSGTASSDGRAQGEGSQHQRDRQLASSAQDPRNPARPAPGDDALYA